MSESLSVAKGRSRKVVALLLGALGIVLALIFVSVNNQTADSHFVRPDLDPRDGEANDATETREAAIERRLVEFEPRQLDHKRREALGEDVFAESLDLLDEMISDPILSSDGELITALKLNRASMVSGQGAKLAMRELARLHDVIQNQKPFVEETFKSPEKLRDFLELLKQWETAMDKVYEAQVAWAGSIREQRAAAVALEDAIRQRRTSDEYAEKLRLSKETRENGQRIIAGMKGMVDVILESKGRCDFLPDYTVSFEDIALQTRFDSHAQAVQEAAGMLRQAGKRAEDRANEIFPRE